MSDVCIIQDEQGQRVAYPKYQYKPLPPGRTIRLLKIQPPSQSLSQSALPNRPGFSIIEHELENSDVANLDVSNSPYIAISYCWESPVFDTPLLITVHGQRQVLPVTASAWEAVYGTLSSIDGYSKMIWIDQICINEADNVEKGSQVMLMSDIYRRCWHCTIWLGLADAETHVAFSLLHRLQESVDFNTLTYDFHRSHVVLTRSEIWADLVLRFGEHMLFLESDPGWRGIAELLQRPWFTRLWTLQEAVLCYKGGAYICCGQHRAKFTTLLRANTVLGRDEIFPGIQFVWRSIGLAHILSLRSSLEQGFAIPFLALLQMGYAKNCSDPRDRVYAFLGLRTEDGFQYPIGVSYEKSVNCVFTDVARSMIQSQKSLRVCAEASERISDNDLNTLPSWVPNWTRGLRSGTFEVDSLPVPFFKSSRGRNHIDNLRDPDVLIVKGKIVDHVAEFIEAEDFDTFEKKSWIDGILPQLVSTLRAITPEKTDMDIAYTIINTLTQGGFLRWNFKRNYGLDPKDWSPENCDRMLFHKLKEARHATIQISDQYSNQWFNSLAQQAILCKTRLFCVLENNLLGLVSSRSHIGDSIAILHGSSLPFVLRPAGDGFFEMVGVCYVDGMMFGEKVDWDEDAADEFKIR